MRIMLLLLISTLGISSCASAPSLTLPETWSDEEGLSVFQGAGMINYFFQLVIKGFNAHIEYQKNGTKLEKDIILSKDDTAFILNNLKAQKFLSIETEPVLGVIYDKGTTTIKFTRGQGKQFVVTDSATEVPKRNSATNFYDLSQRLIDYFTKKLKGGADQF